VLLSADNAEGGGDEDGATNNRKHHKGNSKNDSVGQRYHRPLAGRSLHRKLHSFVCCLKNRRQPIVRHEKHVRIGVCHHRCRQVGDAAPAGAHLRAQERRTVALK
jgi:hypothetical protein